MSPEQNIRVEHELFIRSFFRERPPDRVVRQLAAGMKDAFFTAGSLIYERGSPSERVYFVLNGTVLMEAPGQEPWVLKDQSALGFLDASQARPHARAARAQTEIHALSLLFRDYLDVLEDNFDYAKRNLEDVWRGMHQRALHSVPHAVFPPLASNEPLVPVDRELEMMDRLLVLHRCPLFAHAPVQALVTLAKATEAEIWHPGDRLFTAGDPAAQLRIVVAGTLRAERKSPAAEGLFGPGSPVLGIASIGSSSHEYTVTAQTQAVTVRMFKEELFDVMEDHFTLMRALFTYFGSETERIRMVQTQRTEDLPRIPDSGSSPTLRAGPAS